MDHRGEMAEKRKPFISGGYLWLLSYVFLRPRLGLLMVAMHQRLWRGLLTLVLIAGLGGLFKTLLLLPELMSDCSRIAVFAADRLGDIGIRQGRLFWSEEVELPLTGHIRGYRLDILAEGQETGRRQLLGGVERRGVILTAQTLEYWTSDPSGEGYFERMPLLRPKMLERLEGLAQPGQAAVIARDRLVSTVQALCFLAAPFMGLAFFISFMGTVLFCCCLFALVRMLGGREGKAGFAMIVSISLHLCIPPFLVAVLYHVLFPGLGQFPNVFSVAMLGYLAYMFVEEKIRMIDFRESDE